MNEVFFHECSIFSARFFYLYSFACPALLFHPLLPHPPCAACAGLLADSPWKVYLPEVEPSLTGAVVKGLTPARTYQFRVCAVNQVGKGQYSTETNRYWRAVLHHTPAYRTHREHPHTHAAASFDTGLQYCNMLLLVTHREHPHTHVAASFDTGLQCRNMLLLVTTLQHAFVCYNTATCFCLSQRYSTL